MIIIVIVGGIEPGFCARLDHYASGYGYEWCHKTRISKYSLQSQQNLSTLGTFASVEVEGMNLIHIFQSSASCVKSIVSFHCCIVREQDTYVANVTDTECQLNLTVCTPAACQLRTELTMVTREHRVRLANQVKNMFYHAYSNYMEHAFPHGTLQPISCAGGAFELGKLPLLTLLDTIDTLGVFGDAEEFQHAMHMIISHTEFDLDIEVSVFELTIRALGGLVSAHRMAQDPDLKLMPQYRGELLPLAIDLADRLMPAFHTKTGIPYGTVNLRHGVPQGETTIASTAGAGSLSMEFTMLSYLVGDPKYAKAARGAVRAIFDRRSPLGLLGKHIDVQTGEWEEYLSGPGSNSDSFYEYLVKMYILFDDQEAWKMFKVLYSSVMAYNHYGDWYLPVQMWNGCSPRATFENLVAFWPGMQ